MNRNSNLYTFIFAIVMVSIIASALAYTSTSLKDLQQINVNGEKKQKILATIGIEMSREEATVHFDEYITSMVSVKSDGTVEPSVNAFEIDLKKELKRDYDQKPQTMPIYIAKKEGKTFYVLPLYGSGLWDAIWGYIALEEDENTVYGANFDHKGETPGLGAEITQGWFGEQFIGDKINTKEGEFVSIKVVKGGAKVSDLHGVDGISGGTITSDGVTDMVYDRLEYYLPYFKNN
ncbi:MAG: NADH:ubiquinone reductase (Na(+)-transporting) subunit C [Flavobacteriaceae bacterium]|nr:NADH:ubiquinone reductase (Na(+)-transporting) subunit C [Flavobacteriaceae bacterium]